MSTVYQYRHRERGATALVIVMFSILLFVVVSVGFIQLMTSEQRSSSDDELSRGAYDSALAGVEDGKRVLKECLDGDNSACAIIDAGQCDTTSAAKIVNSSDGEVYLRSESSNGSNGEEYAQAYTCVKIDLNTDDYLGYLDDDASSAVVIPIKTVSQASNLTFQWFATVAGASGTTLEGLSTPTLLPTKSGWPSARPPILRVELINLQGNPIDTLDTASGQWTTYLYPKRGSSSTYFMQAVDGRSHGGSGMLEPNVVGCNADITTNISGYVCSASIVLPGGVDTTANGVYVRVTTMYNSTDISVSPQDASGDDTEYVRVQPSIDSTGRASDVFRRVEARVESTDDQATYPRATVDITGSLCKVLSVTDTYSGTSGTCTP